jgi:protein tyrosine/serine phosphatase
MKRKKIYRLKSTRFLLLVSSLTILTFLTSAYFVGEYGLPFGSHLANNKRLAGTIRAQGKWAEPIELPGLPNLHKVSNDLYRGAQPTGEGFKQLEKLGIKTVVNLRTIHSDRTDIKGTNLSYEHIRMATWNIEDNDVIRFLQIATDPNRTPVFVHCQHGADRTGTVCTVYRIVVEGWSKDEAIEEMTKGGFGYHSFWRNLLKYVRKLDVQKIRKKAGLNS